MDWIITFWNTHKEVILPIINTTLVTFILPLSALWIKIKMREVRNRAELQLEALKNVANREDVKPEIKGITDVINSTISGMDKITDKITYLSEMFNLVFQNSVGLTDEIKTKLEILNNKLNDTSTDAMLIEVTKELEKVKSTLDATLAKTQVEKAEVVENSVPMKDKKKKNRLGR